VCRPTPIAIVPTDPDTDLRVASASRSAEHVVDAATPTRKRDAKAPTRKRRVVRVCASSGEVTFVTGSTQMPTVRTQKPEMCLTFPYSDDSPIAGNLLGVTCEAFYGNRANPCGPSGSRCRSGRCGGRRLRRPRRCEHGNRRCIANVPALVGVGEPEPQRHRRPLRRGHVDDPGNDGHRRRSLQHDR